MKNAIIFALLAMPVAAFAQNNNPGGGGGGSAAGTAGAIQSAGTGGAFADSGCTATGGTMNCANMFANTMLGNQQIAGFTTPAMILSRNGGQFLLYNASSSADQKAWDTINDSASGCLYWRAVNDANTAATNWMSICRNATAITSLTFPIGITAPSFFGNANTASNLSGTPALPNGTTVTTQTAGDSTTKPASTAFVSGAVAAVAGGVCTAAPSAGAVNYNDTGCSVFNVGQLSAAVTSATTTGFKTGKTYTFQIQQNATTAYPNTWPASFLNFPPMVTALGKTLSVQGYYDGTNVRYQAATADAGYNFLPAGTVPSTSPTGGAYTYGNPTTYNLEAKLPGGQTTQAVLPVLYAADTATSGTTYTACPVDFNGTMQTGMRVTFYPATDSSGGATTLKLCSAAALSVFRKDGATTLTQREWLANTPHTLAYNGTSWVEESSNFPRLISANNNIASDTSAVCTAGSTFYFATTATIPANELGNGAQVRIRTLYQQSTTSGIVATYQYLKVGTGNVASNAFALSTAITNAGVWGDYILTGTAAAGASTTVDVLNSTATTGFNLVGSQVTLATNTALTVSIGEAVASASSQTCSYTNRQLIVERVN